FLLRIQPSEDSRTRARQERESRPGRLEKTGEKYKRIGSRRDDTSKQEASCPAEFKPKSRLIRCSSTASGSPANRTRLFQSMIPRLKRSLRRFLMQVPMT